MQFISRPSFVCYIYIYIFFLRLVHYYFPERGGNVRGRTCEYFATFCAFRTTIYTYIHTNCLCTFPNESNEINRLFGSVDICRTAADRPKLGLINLHNISLLLLLRLSTPIAADNYCYYIQ